MVVESIRKELSLKRRREAHDRRKKGVLAVLWATYYQWQTNVLAAAAILFSSDHRSAKRHRDEHRAFYLSTLTRGANEGCVSELRLNIASFDFLCALLRNRGLLRDTREVSVEEEVASLLHILGHGVRIRTMATRLFRSGETISRHFHEVLNAILSISPNFIRRTGPNTPSGPYPFEGAIGALDGTHIPAHLPLTMQSSYKNWKGTLTQNVLAACGFDMKFQYNLPGWGGSATDARILQHALSRLDGLIVPPGRYYLVDAGYPNAPGFLAPYRSVRYHINEHRGRTPQNSRELFNKRHSQARNVIERVFGTLKNQFAMLKTSPPYEFGVQVSIVLVCSVLHNFILEQNVEIGDEDTTSIQGSENEVLDCMVSIPVYDE